jgi:hypothetical protein
MTTDFSERRIPSADGLLFLQLGGVGEIGASTICAGACR